MDRIMPIDLERAQLRKSFRGYAVKEVDTLLQGAADTMQSLLVENDALKQEMERQRAELDRSRRQEDTLKDTLLLAQKAADDTRASAQRHADALLEEARNGALAERVAAQQAVSEMRWEVERVKAERKKFAEEFRSMLERYQRELNYPASLTIVEGDAAAAGA